MEWRYPGLLAVLLLLAMHSAVVMWHTYSSVLPRTLPMHEAFVAAAPARAPVPPPPSWPRPHRLAEQLVENAYITEPYRLVKVQTIWGGGPFFFSKPSKEDYKKARQDDLLNFLFVHEMHVMELFDFVLRGRDSEYGHRYVGLRQHFLDVGSNSGFYTMLARSHDSSGMRHYLAIDPQPHCNQLVRSSLVASGFDDGHADVLNAFVGDPSSAAAPWERVHTTHQVKARSGCWGTFPEPHNTQASTRAAMLPDVAVPVLALDELLDPANDVVLLMKMDVEGAELDAFAGMKQMLQSRNVLNIVVELNKPAWRRNNVTHAQVLDMVTWMASIGYSLRPHYDHREEVAIQDWPEFLEAGWVVIDLWLTLQSAEEIAAVGTFEQTEARMREAAAENAMQIDK